MLYSFFMFFVFFVFVDDDIWYSYDTQMMTYNCDGCLFSPGKHPEFVTKMNEDDDDESGSDESSSSDECKKKAQTKKRTDIEDACNNTNERIGRKRKRRS